MERLNFYESKNKRPRTQYDNENSNREYTEEPDEYGFKLDKNGKIIAYPSNIKIIDARAFNLGIQEEDSELIHRLVQISTGIPSSDVLDKKDAITINILTEKDPQTSKTMTYIIQIQFPIMRFTLDELTRIKLYSPDRITNIETGYDKETNKTFLDITVLSSNNHISYGPRLLYVSQTSVQHYHLDDRTRHSDTKFLKRKKIQ